MKRRNKTYKCVVDICTVAAWKEREKCFPAESYHRKQSNMYSGILVSLFKGHTSIPRIQISMEKAYQSYFAQLSSHPPDRTRMKQTMLKAILPPPPYDL